jgi:NAD-dependent deacetylase
VKKIVILTGAGISAESGINTFRGSNGLWEGHDIYEVASPEGWKRNPGLVLDFYNKRRAQLHEVVPNEAHFAISELSKSHHVHVITQNVDDLHERAGNPNISHLHGELRKVRSEFDQSYVIPFDGDLLLGDLCPKGHQLRPHIVWFGEAVPLIDKAIQIMHDSDEVWIIGTSMKVYPAAGLVSYAPPSSQIVYIDPNPQINYELSRFNVRVIENTAAKATPLLVEQYL